MSQFLEEVAVAESMEVTTPAHKCQIHSLHATQERRIHGHLAIAAAADGDARHAVTAAAAAAAAEPAAAAWVLAAVAGAAAAGLVGRGAAGLLQR